jgi:hypothetical protein
VDIEETTEYTEEGKDYQGNNSAGKEERQTERLFSRRRNPQVAAPKGSFETSRRGGRTFICYCCFPAKPADDGLFL